MCEVFSKMLDGAFVSGSGFEIYLMVVEMFFMWRFKGYIDKIEKNI